MIEMRHVSFGYAQTPVLREMSLLLPDGQVTALIGPNGAGKSTAIRLMAGLLRPQAGEVLLDGEAPNSLERRALARRLSFLPQDRPIPAISVASLVMHGRFPYLGASRRPSRPDREAVERALAATGLTECAGRELRTLSGGQRQKAYLAMLMAQDTRNVLLDEPFNHLDIRFQLELTELLQTLAREGRCVGVVLHDLSLLPQLGGGAALLHQGHVRMFATAEECLWSDAMQDAFEVRTVSRDGVAFLKKT